MAITEYQLTDRYRKTSGQVHLTGIQALARIPIEQLRLDAQAGLATAAYISGYPGSPLAGLDAEMRRAISIAGSETITHQPAVNEELAATAVMGSQLAAVRPDCRYDGVVGMWYGKAPGLDRATDALRHAVFCGTSEKGGALAVVGDDPESKSSTMPSSSDAALVDLHMPILYPATIAECLELGLHGIAMSRVTGLWSALKVVTPIADGSGSVEIPVGDTEAILPIHEVDGAQWRPEPSAQFLGRRMVEVEREFHEVRLELARQYGLLNGLNRLPANPSDAWLGIVATGYTYSQVVESLRRLGLETTDDISAVGIRLLHLRLPVPFDHEVVAGFAEGLDEILVVEEKNPTLEQMIRDALYPTNHRPLVVGKRDDRGERLLPSHGLLDADTITPALRRRLSPRLEHRLAPPPPTPRQLIPVTSGRTPFFCSGCPHNWGTKVPEGALVGMGTGCHGMTLLMDEDRVGESAGITAMGNEGAQWLGMAPFVNTTHFTQNLGDGTYFHSAQLAVQAAIGAGTNVTFKLLYNDTVAMTGGQQATFQVGVVELARILLLQGVAEVAITTEDVSRYRGAGLPRSITVGDRADIVDVQQRLADVPGVTVLIHDQACAAETRLARRRGRLTRPKTRVVINHRICEGCGNCGEVSNCLSVQPVDTPLGRKTTIDQASCNIDLSCLGGDCPAFMTIEVDDEPESSAADVAAIDDLPAPTPPALAATGAKAAVAIRLVGIGGTGVVTVAQVLSVAGLTAGLEVDGVDQTGLSQKAGPVVSDVTISSPGSRRTNLIGRDQADVMLAFDLLVAAGSNATALRPGAAVVASTTITPTGRQVADVNAPAHSTGELLDNLDRQTGETTLSVGDALAAATALVGVPETANMFVLGAALQAGTIPLPLEAVEGAIALNGVAVEANLAALTWGRLAVHDRPRFEEHLRARREDAVTVSVSPLAQSLSVKVDALTADPETHSVVAMLAADLVSYQSEVYAARFLQSLEPVMDPRCGDQVLEAAARSLHHLMAYKDEYEVARLMIAPDGLAEAARVAGRPLRNSALKWHLHPPALRAMGLNRKIPVPLSASPAVRLLAASKKLRGSPFDPFGRAALRRVERRMADEFPSVIAVVANAVTSGVIGRAEAVDVLLLALDVRGFEEIKAESADRYRNELATALAGLDPTAVEALA